MGLTGHFVKYIITNQYAASQDYGADYMARFARRDDCARAQLDVEVRE